MNQPMRGTLRHAVSIARQNGTAMVQEAARLAYLAEAYLGAGELRRARDTAELAVDAARQHKVRFFEITGPSFLWRARCSGPKVSQLARLSSPPSPKHPRRARPAWRRPG